jgi:hypothetical protein
MLDKMDFVGQIGQFKTIQMVISHTHDDFSVKKTVDSKQTKA